MAEPYVGQLMLCPYTFAPTGWADCLGQLLPISQYTALFSLLGVTYGGNGTSNFGLPNLQSCVVVSQGALPDGDTYVMGEPGGAEAVTLTQVDLPVHSHAMMANGVNAASNTAAGAMLGKVRNVTVGGLYGTGPANTTLLPSALGSTGTGSSHNNMQPFLVLRYIIALQGVFPTRP